MELRDVLARIDEHSRSRREDFRAQLDNRRPFLERRKRNRQFLVIALVVVLVAAGSVLLQGSRTTEVPLDSVVERFREERVAEQRRVSSGEPAMAGTPGRTVRRDTQRTSAEASNGIESYGLPPEGVYAFGASGSEQLSVFGAEHTYPERVFATVRHVGGCGWEATLEVIEEHTDVIGLCSEPRRFTQTEQSRSVQFFGVRDGASIACTPSLIVHLTNEEPGASSTHSCSDGEGSEASIERTFTGVTSMRIGGSTVRAVHVHLESSLSGRATGTSVDDIWVSPETGLLYRWKRSVDTDTRAAWGVDAHYTEEADFVLESLEPLR